MNRDAKNSILLWVGTLAFVGLNTLAAMAIPTIGQGRAKKPKLSGVVAVSLACAIVVQPSVAAAEYCNPIPGVELIGDPLSANIIVIGDYHGTSEIPEFFGDLVCSLRSSGETVLVGLEWPQNASGALERYTHDRSLANRIALLEAISITRQDGRGSEAMLDLVDQLVDSENSGIPQFVLFQPTGSFSGSEYEEQMARILQDSFDEIRPDRLVVLVGNAHAMKAPFADSDIKPMAAFLPEERTRTFNVEGYYGSSWSCRRTVQSTSADCRVWPLQDGAPGPRRIFATEEQLFDGRYSVGTAFTPSEPADPRSFPDSRLRARNLPGVPLPAIGPDD